WSTPGRTAGGRRIRGGSVEQCTMDLCPGRTVLGDFPPTPCEPAPERLGCRPTAPRRDERQERVVLQAVAQRLQAEGGDDQRCLVTHLCTGAGIEEGSVPVATVAPDVAPRLAVLLPGHQRVEVQLTLDPV